MFCRRKSDEFFYYYLFNTIELGFFNWLLFLLDKQGKGLDPMVIATQKKVKEPRRGTTPPSNTKKQHPGRHVGHNS